MTRIAKNIPIIKNINNNGFKTFFDSFFYYGSSRFVVVENRGKGQLVLKKCEFPTSAAQRGIKIALLFTGIVPLFALGWNLIRSIYISCASRKWTIITDMPTKEMIVGNLDGKGALLKWPEKPVVAHSGIKNPNKLCWLNSEVQILAHFKHLRALFSPRKNPIEKRLDETETAFTLREEIQLKGNVLIQAILRGDSPIDSINEFGFLLEKAGLIERRAEFFKVNFLQMLPHTVTEYLKQKVEPADKSLELLDLEILEPNNFPKDPPQQILIHENSLKCRVPSLKSKVPTTLEVNASGPTYILQGATGGGKHYRAFIRGDDNKFLIFDDHHVKATKSDGLRIAEFTNYYYVRSAFAYMDVE